MADLQPLRFLRHHMPYAAGEVAWFAAHEAKTLIAGGFAVHHAEAVPESATVPADRPIIPDDKAISGLRGRFAVPEQPANNEENP